MMSFTWLFFNLKYYRGETIFTAGREFNLCYKELVLKDNNTFVDNLKCFMNDYTRGTYEIVNDTIYFENYTSEDGNYKYGLIEESIYGNVLNLYDQSGYFKSQIPITYNGLIK